MKQVYFFVSFFYIFSFYGQQKIDTIRFFYAINSINPNNIDELSKVKNAGQPEQIVITGFADFLHTTDYNRSLSQKRADHISKLIVQQYPELRTKIISTSGMGEQFSKGDSAAGEQWWRRVDVIITRTINTKPVQKPVVEKPVAEKPAEEKATSKEQADAPKKLEDLKKGETITLEGLSFIPGRHMILPNSKPKLDELLTKLQENPELKIEIQGHVCCTDNGADGLDHDTKDNNLSVNRAKAVYQYLIRNGIDKDRLRYRGFGGSRPKVKETSEENEQINRRVEIMVISGASEEVED